MVNGSFAIRVGPKAPWWARIIVYFMRTRFRFSLPQSWDEVSPELIPDIFRILAERPEGRVGLELLRVLLPIRAGLFFRIRSIDFVEKLLPYVQWIEEQPATDIPVRSIEHQGKRYYLFAPHLENVTMREYIAADTAYTELTAAPDAGRLAAFLAIVLREVEKDEARIRETNDVRIPYSQWDTRDRAELLHDLPAGWQYYVLHVFGHAKQAVFDRYLPTDPDKKKKDLQPAADWEDILTDVAETGVFGNLDQVKATTVPELFGWLAKNRRAALRRQQEELQQQIAANHRKYLA